MLIIDTPNKCCECPCFTNNHEEDDICELNGNTVYPENRPKWCPLLKLNMQTMDAILQAIRNPKQVRMSLCDYVNKRK